jgi:hypothetical protein
MFPADRDAVEFGVVIANEWQGNGLGRGLVRALLETGPRRWVTNSSSSSSMGTEPLCVSSRTCGREAVASRDGELIHYAVGGSTAIASMDTRSPRGSRTFAGAERAGGGSGMCRAYTAFRSGKSSTSA